MAGFAVRYFFSGYFVILWPSDEHVIKLREVFYFVLFWQARNELVDTNVVFLFAVGLRD